jgi:hypothetical protein
VTTGAVSNDRTITFTYTEGTDDDSGLAGYSVQWDSAAGTIPDTSVEVAAGPQTFTSPALSDGAQHWVHIRALDNEGNAAPAVLHFGPFSIDGTPPGSNVTLADGTAPEASHIVGSKVFFNPAIPGSTSVTVAPTKIIGNATFPDPDAAAAGWTLTPNNGVLSAAPWTVTYAWGTGATSSGTKIVSMLDGVGNVGTSSPFEFVADSTGATSTIAAPTGLNLRQVKLKGTTTDGAGSGLTVYNVRYTRGTASGFSCIPLAVPVLGNWSCVWSTPPLLSRGTYQLKLSVTDNVGNVGTVTRTVMLAATAFDDVFTGTATADVFNGIGGDDTVNGGLGADTLMGGPNEDWLNGGNGNDKLFANSGAVDTLVGGFGNDTLNTRDGKIGDIANCGENFNDKDIAYIDTGDKAVGCETVRAV